MPEDLPELRDAALGALLGLCAHDVAFRRLGGGAVGLGKGGEGRAGSGGRGMAEVVKGLGVCRKIQQALACDCPECGFRIWGFLVFRWVNHFLAG